MGEAGPGDCLGLLASKLWPTAVRGQMYGVAAAVGKIGAFVGTWAFPAIIADFPAGELQPPFYPPTEPNAERRSLASVEA